MKMHPPPSVTKAKPATTTAHPPRRKRDVDVEALVANMAPLSRAPIEPAIEPSPPRADALLVDQDAAAHQLPRLEFLKRLRGELQEVVAAELVGTGWSAEQCPWLEYWFAYYDRRNSAQIEAALRRYEPAVGNATAADDYFAPLAARVRSAVRRWRVTGEVDAPAAELPDTIATLTSLGPGVPLDSNVRSRMEQAMGASFAATRIHTGANAASAAASVNARAFTLGSHVAFGSQEYRPGSEAGDALLAHELAHVEQQRDAPIATTLEAGSATHEHNADRAVAHVAASRFGLVGLGRWRPIRSGLRLQRCSSKRTVDDAAVAKDAGLTEKDLRLKRNQDELAATNAVLDAKPPASVSGRAAATAKQIALEHWVAVDSGGHGKKTGTVSHEAGWPDDGPTCDCTEYVASILRHTFKPDTWKRVKKKAISLNKDKTDTGLNGLELQSALMSELSWKLIFWAPDPGYTDYQRRKRDSHDHVVLDSHGDPIWEHDSEPQDRAPLATQKKSPSYYNMRVSQSVLNYRPERSDGVSGRKQWTPTDSKTVKDTSTLEKLRKLPFGVLTMRGGYHVAAIIHGVVYEVHWEKTSTDLGLYEAEDLETYGWNSGAIVAPADEVDKAFK